MRHARSACVDFGSMPITTLAVQIWAFCASTGRADEDRWSCAPAASGGRRCSARCTATSTPCSAGTRTRKLLTAAGAQAEHLETGCCGFAGNFGFQVGHGEVSEACAERALLPPLREAAPGAVVLAGGFSCRTQIHELDSGGREAMHLAELLATAGGLDHDHPERTAAPPPGPATPDGQGRRPGRNRRRSWQAPRR